MEDWLFYLLTTLLCLLLYLLFLKAQTPAQAHGPPLPPGPKPMHILGPLLFLRRSGLDMESTLRRLRRAHGPILSFSMLNPARPAIFVAARGPAHRALVQSGPAFASRPEANASGRVLSSNQHNISSAPYGPTWRALRRNLAAEVLHPARLRAFAPARRWVIDVLLSHLRSQGAAKATDPVVGDGGNVVVVMESFQYAMFCLLVYMCFGDKLDTARIRAIEAVQRELLASFLSFQVFAFWPAVTKVVFRKRWHKLLSLRRQQEEMFFPLIRARRAMMDAHERDSADDCLVYCYVDSLIRLKIPEDGGRPLTDGEIVSLCSEFLSAGTDTTATALQWILANLVKNPAMQQRLREEIVGVVGESAEREIQEDELQKMEYLKATVLEGLRRHPPGHFVLPHTVVEETTLDGYRIPKGASVNFTVADMGLDEEVWSEPLEFKPERFLPGGEGDGVDLTGSREIKMMPFGAGRRVCPGMALALLHLEYFVANLVKDFEWHEVEGEEVDLTEKLEFTVVMKRLLKARIVPRRKIIPG